MTPIPQITAAEASHYSLSIRTTSGGLAFCITSEGVEGAATPRCIHSGRLEASASAHSVYEVLQELYFTYEFLSYPYRSIKFFYEPEQAVLVPTSLLQEGRDELWLPHSEDSAGSRQGEALSALRYTLPDDTKTFVLSWQREAYQFLRRTLLLVKPEPHFAPIVEEERSKSRATQGRELLLLLRPNAMDLFIIAGGEVEAYNSASIIAGHNEEIVAGEVVFYTFAFWRHFALEGNTDRLTIAVSEEEKAPALAQLQGAAHEASELLRPYISQITIQGYHSLPHAGSEAAISPQA